MKRQTFFVLSLTFACEDASAHAGQGVARASRPWHHAQGARATLTFAFGEDFLGMGEVRMAEPFVNLHPATGVLERFFLFPLP